MLEVCIDSLESAFNAIDGGADELEVCSSLSEGGLTPTAGLVKTIKKAVRDHPIMLLLPQTFNPLEINDIPLSIAAGSLNPELCTKKPKINVMIRCRTGSDFVYSDQEMQTMMADIYTFKEIGIDRIVFGALTGSQEIDKEKCLSVIKAAFPLPVTFHRAFDMCKEPYKAIEKLIDMKIDRVLTSGQRSSANDDKAMELIKSLVETYGDKIEIMPGAGVNERNAKSFIDIGCKIVHSSCKMIRHLPKIDNHLTMGTSDSESVYVTEKSIVQRTKKVLSV